MKVKILLTEEEIKNGQKGSFHQCPWGLAFKRVFPKCNVSLEWIYGDSTNCYVNVQRTGEVYFNLQFKLPKSITKALEKWEFEDGVLKPSEFEIELVMLKEMSYDDLPVAIARFYKEEDIDLIQLREYPEHKTAVMTIASIAGIHYFEQKEGHWEISQK